MGCLFGTRLTILAAETWPRPITSLIVIEATRKWSTVRPLTSCSVAAVKRGTQIGGRAQLEILQKWTKSSFSHMNGNCIEVAGLSNGQIRVRDSKNPNGFILGFSPAEWNAFVDDVRIGDFDRS
jgi:hypothetical protein